MNKIRSDETGFTIIEVMVAILILVVGVLGSTTLLNTSNTLTVNERAREGATNLAREVLEAARSVDYDSLTPTGAAGAIQAKPGLDDADGNSANGWQVVRRGRTYTINTFNGSTMNDAQGNPTPCAWDDPRDGLRSQSDTSLGTLSCANNAAALPSTTSACGVPPTPGTDGTGCIDTNPDDYRRLALNVSWTLNGKTRSVNQQGVIVNPSGGLGPRITGFVRTTPDPNSFPVITDPNTTTVTFTVTTGPNASEVDWAADDEAADQGTATASGTPNTWTFNWDIKAASDPAAVVDGNYTVSVQAFDAAGIPGDLQTITVSLNRSVPAAPTGLVGGRDNRSNDPTWGQIIDLQWSANSERDIVGYRVYRVGSPDTLVATCDTTTFPVKTQTFCADLGNNSLTNTPGVSDTLLDPVRYYVKAVDNDPSTNTAREGTASSTITIPSIDSPPTFSGTLTASGGSGSNVTLTWPAATGAAFYRIYRGGKTYTDRYDSTGSASQVSYTDPDSSASSHTYYVTAVSSNFEESAPLGPVTQ